MHGSVPARRRGNRRVGPFSMIQVIPERRRGKRGEGETVDHQLVVLSHAPPAGGSAVHIPPAGYDESCGGGPQGL